MQVIVENAVSHKNTNYDLALRMLNNIIHLITSSEDEEVMEKYLARYFLIKRARIPFRYGYCSEGLELYQDGVDKRILFVPCKTDVEI